VILCFVCLFACMVRRHQIRTKNARKHDVPGAPRLSAGDLHDWPGLGEMSEPSKMGEPSVNVDAVCGSRDHWKHVADLSSFSSIADMDTDVFQPSATYDVDVDVESPTHKEAKSIYTDQPAAARRSSFDAAGRRLSFETDSFGFGRLSHEGTLENHVRRMSQAALASDSKDKDRDRDNLSASSSEDSKSGSRSASPVSGGSAGRAAGLSWIQQMEAQELQSGRSDESERAEEPVYLVKRPNMPVVTGEPLSPTVQPSAGETMFPSPIRHRSARGDDSSHDDGELEL
jgi:hypothetical protein